MKNIHVSFERRNIRGVDFLFLSFPYDFQVKEYVKRFPGMKWSQSNRSFCVPFSHNLQNQLESYLMRKDYIKVVFNNKIPKELDSELKILSLSTFLFFVLFGIRLIF